MEIKTNKTHQRDEQIRIYKIIEVVMSDINENKIIAVRNDEETRKLYKEAAGYEQ